MKFIHSVIKIKAMNEGTIPENKKGVKSDTVSSVELTSTEQAIQHYERVRNRFLDVNNWHAYAGVGSAEFTLRNAKGEMITGQLPQKGNYFEIAIPGPANEAGEGKDWVQIADISEISNADFQCITIKVHPAASPVNNNTETAHFFDEEASSTFIIRREGRVVSAEVHGRNETPNTDEVGLRDKIRNTVVALGAMLGFSKIQWKNLTSGLVNAEG